MSRELIEARIKLSNALERERKHRHPRFCRWCGKLQAEVDMARAVVRRLEGNAA